MNNHELTAAVQKAADSAGAKVKIEPAGALFLEVYMENKNHVLERAWYVDEVEQTITPFEFNFETTEWNTGDTKSYSNSNELTDVMTDFFKDAQSELFEAKKSEADGDKDVFTIDLFRIYADGDEDMVDDMQAAQTFYDEDEAIKVANKLADSYADDDDVVFAVVMAGEREKPNGDIVGEPSDIYWASSSNPAKTAEYRKKARFAAYDGKMDYYAKQTESKKSEDTVDDYAKRLKSGERIEDIIQQIKDAPDPKIGTFYTEKELGILKNVFKQYVEDVSKIKYSVPSDYKISYDIQETPTNDFYAVVKATRDDGDTIYLCNVAGEVVYDYNTPKQFKCSIGEVSPKGGGEMVGHYIVRPQSVFLDDEFYGKDNPRFYLKSTEIDDIDDHFKKGFKKKSSEAHTEGFSLELIDTIRVPAWLWKAYLFNDTNDLEPDEIETFEKFKETYKNNHLDDREEEPYFSSHNDFDSLGGDVYDVDVYKRSDMPSEKKSEAVKDFPDGKRYKFNFNFYNPKTANIAEQAAKDKGIDCTKEQTIITIAVANPQDAISFADAIVNLAQSDGENKTDRHDIDKAFNIAVKKDADYEANKDTIDAALTDHVVELTPSPRHNLLYILGELTDVVDFLEAIK